MCGIAGIMMSGGAPADAAVLDRLCAAMLHRGPDGTGRYLDGALGIAQTRLAIVDLATGETEFVNMEL